MDNFVLEQHGDANSANNRTVKNRETERKRTRGEASCAECRRLKLKCDKKLPCSSCVRRGCASICPNGTLATKQGNKYVLADTEKLHKKLLEMSRRIRQLEDALQIAQASISSSPHPLLADDLLSIKHGVEAPDDLEKDLSNPDWDIYTSFGTLSISERGETRFVGRSSSEALMAAVEQDGSSEQQLKPKLPSDIADVAETFPFTPVHLPKDKIMGMIKDRLPSYERATALVEAYLQHLSWFFRPVKRDQIVEELIPMFYKRKASAPLPPSEPGLEAHQLALLFGVFAAGSAGDLTLEPYNEEGEMYRQLGRTALGLHSIFEGTSLVTVQALALISVYDFFSCNTQTLDSAWKLVSMALCLASSIGLHWDPTSWDLDEKQIQRRRSVFWELCAFDSWKSLGSGRPAVFHMHEIDCRYPEDTDAEIGEDGKKVPGFWAWKHDYGRTIISAVADRMCTVKPTRYSEILELDRKVRDYKITTYKSPIPELESQVSPAQTPMTLIYREITLLFIHRNFFARAMQENPTNPVRSRFAPSFLSAYASSITVLRTLRQETTKRSRPLLRRQWPLWAHALVGAVIVGTVAARDTPSELSRSALKELELAIGLFDLMTDHPVVRNGLPILLRIREKARSKVSGAGASGSTATSGERDAEVDEALSIIGGATRILRKVKHLRGTPPSDSPSSTSSTAISSPSSNEASLSSPPLPRLAFFGGAVNTDAGNIPSAFGMQEPVNRNLNIDNETTHHLSAEPQTGRVESDMFTSDNTGVHSTQPSVPSSEQYAWLPSATNTQPLFPVSGTPLPGNPLTDPGLSSLDLASDSFMNAFDFNAEYPALLPSADFPMAIENMNFDFDVSGELNSFSDPRNNYELDLEFTDPTVAQAWRSIMEDPRFASSGAGAGPF